MTSVTVAALSRGTMGSMAARTSEIGRPAMLVTRCPMSASYGGNASTTKSPSLNDQSRSGRLETG